jgi:phage/plasmid-like protein (TIGR03299 family)
MAVLAENRVAPAVRLGKRISGASNIQEALVNAGLDGEVKVSENAVSSPIITDSGVTNLVIPDKFITYRTIPATGELKPLGVVGNRYVPIQDSEAFDFLNLVVDEVGATVEGVGTMAGGKRTVMYIKMPNGIKVGGYDQVDLNLLAHNSHDGSTAFTVAVTPMRLFCTNQVRMALKTSKSKISLKHTFGAKAKVAQARETLGLVFEYQTAFEAEVERLIAQEFDTSQFEKLVETILPLDKANASKAQITKTQEAHATLNGLWYADTQATIFGTKWAAYNAVAEYADWFKPVRGGEDKELVRAERIVSGASDELKNRALALL